MSRSPRYAVFISGRGSNLRALLESHQLHAPSLVLSSRKKAAGLEHARDAEIPELVVRRRDFSGGGEFCRALNEALEDHAIEWVVLAGFMVILPDEFVERWSPRIVNIHPSLLPLFPGLHPHRQALDAGVEESGCTVHLVEPGDVDGGKVLAQATVPVRTGDTEESLAARILEAEHRLYPETLVDLLA